jgi:hypothetical protein
MKAVCLEDDRVSPPCAGRGQQAALSACTFSRQRPWYRLLFNSNLYRRAHAVLRIDADPAGAGPLRRDSALPVDRCHIRIGAQEAIAGRMLLRKQAFFRTIFRRLRTDHGGIKVICVVASAAGVPAAESVSSPRRIRRLRGLAAALHGLIGDCAFSARIELYSIEVDIFCLSADGAGIGFLVSRYSAGTPFVHRLVFPASAGGALVPVVLFIAAPVGRITVSIRRDRHCGEARFRRSLCVAEEPAAAFARAFPVPDAAGCRAGHRDGLMLDQGMSEGADFPCLPVTTDTAGARLGSRFCASRRFLLRPAAEQMVGRILLTSG